MSSFTDFFPAPGGGGGGGIPKYQEFTTSGTFTPTQALIDAGGYIGIFLVGGGGRGGNQYSPGSGGETILTQMYLTSITGCAVTIGAGATSNGAAGSSSTFAGSSAGGTDLTAAGGTGNYWQDNKLGSGFSAVNDGNWQSAGGSGVLGYGGGGATSVGGGVRVGKANSGQGTAQNNNGGSGYCLIKWYE